MNEVVFFVEDDEGIFQLIDATLSVSNFKPVGFTDPLEMLEALKTTKPDIFILDIMLPNMDGYDLIKHLKEKPEYSHIPIIVVSAKSSELDKVKGLDLVCDDYLTKPFGVLELIARIKANLRRSEHHSELKEILTLGEITLDLSGYTASINGKDLNLTLKEFEILKVLMENVDKAMSREKLFKLIWNSEYFIETRCLDMHIKSIRDKILKHTDKEYIVTVRGVGYKFTV